MDRGRAAGAPGTLLLTRPATQGLAEVPVHVATLVLQDIVEPRLLTASTPTLRVQAISDGHRVAFSLCGCGCPFQERAGSLLRPAAGAAVVEGRGEDAAAELQALGRGASLGLVGEEAEDRGTPGLLAGPGRPSGQ
jgi:hypothetical protein